MRAPRSQPPILILERIKTCEHCGGEMRVSALSYEENPYCTRCLRRRVSAHAVPRLRWRRRGRYLEPIDAGS